MGEDEIEMLKLAKAIGFSPRQHYLVEAAERLCARGLMNRWYGSAGTTYWTSYTLKPEGRRALRDAIAIAEEGH